MGFRNANLMLRSMIWKQEMVKEEEKKMKKNRKEKKKMKKRFLKMLKI